MRGRGRRLPGSTSRTSSRPTSSPRCSTARASPSAGSATKDGTLYHGRILDYGCDWRLQEHAVLTIAEPEGKIPFVNVTYAGFIGSVTGMNARRRSRSARWAAGAWATGRACRWRFLVRMALEEAGDLDEAIAVFRDHPRTCEYYYVIADGKTGQAVGMEASWDVFGVVADGRVAPPAAARRRGRRPPLGRRPLRRAGAAGEGGPRHLRRRQRARP